MNMMLGRGSALLCALWLAACDKPPPAPAPVPPLTAVLQLQAQPLELSDVLPGRVAALRVAEIRPQVTGIVERRLFEQGAEVAAGQALFQIQPAPFAAEVAVAAAALQSAEAALSGARLQLNRLQSLQASGAVSRQLYDEALTQHAKAKADVAQASALLARRRLDLNFATVVAPIHGRIDQTLVSEGALVSATDSQPLTRVQQIDQVYVDVRQSAALLQGLSEELRQQGLRAEILDSRGQATGLSGQLLFTGVNVDPGTGDVQLRILVDNPDRQLLPGMYVQARLPRVRYASALAVPQQAVIRQDGQTYVWLLDARQQARLAAVTLGELVGQQYPVLRGLSAGQQVVVAGTERLSEGTAVMTEAWQPPATAVSGAASTH